MSYLVSWYLRVVDAIRRGAGSDHRRVRARDPGGRRCGGGPDHVGALVGQASGVLRSDHRLGDRRCVCRVSARRRQRGSATVEFSLVLPLLFVVALGLIQVGLLARDRLLVEAAARAGARAAAVEADPAEVKGARFGRPRRASMRRANDGHRSTREGGAGRSGDGAGGVRGRRARAVRSAGSSGRRSTSRRYGGHAPGVRMRPGERGSMSVVMAAIVAVMLVCTMGVADVGRRSRRARKPAPRPTPRRSPPRRSRRSRRAPSPLRRRCSARRNGAELIDCVCAAGSFEAVVTVQRRAPICCSSPAASRSMSAPGRWSICRSGATSRGRHRGQLRSRAA